MVLCVQAKQEAELAEVRGNLEETRRQLEELQDEGRGKDVQIQQLRSEVVELRRQTEVGGIPKS